MLIIFGGLPGCGKSTIAQALAMQIQACWLWLDTIENAIRFSAPLVQGQGVGPSGYVALYALAADNLRLGQTVIADSVNPMALTRNAFRAVATDADRRYIEVEVFCSDVATHRRRVDARYQTDNALNPPDWAAVERRAFEPWCADVRLDTCKLSVEDSVKAITSHLLQVK